MLNRLRGPLCFALYTFVLAIALSTPAIAQVMNPRYYDAGAPAYTDLWVDPVHGSDANNALTRAHAVQTVAAAWGMIPANTPLTHAYRIMFCPGDYAESSFPSANWFELRQGSLTHPVVLQAADGQHTARIHAYLQFDNCSYLYVIGLDFVTDPGYGGGGNVIHYSNDNHMLLRGCSLNGWDGSVRQPQETLKVNQCQYMYVEDCDISNAFWMGLDYVAVQYGHIQGNKIHDTDNDCLMVKGGSAYLRIEGNEVYNVGQCGLVAGQGTTFGFMVTPWLHYEVYDTKFINNIVHNVQNAGIAARGAYNVLFAHNTFYKVGQDQGSGSGLILCSPGGRVCQGDLDICLTLHNLGGWGQTTIGDESECIPNRNVFIYDNVFYNPDVHTLYGHFVVFGPQIPPAGTNIPSPVKSDDNLQIRGNIFWDGPAGWSDGLDDGQSGCQASNPTCNETLLHSQNAINTVRPQLIDPAHGNFRPVPGGNVYHAAPFPIPSFAGNDRQQHPLAPLGNLVNTNARDFDGHGRTGVTPPGAYAPVAGDVNGDGVRDIALYNAATHYVAFWYLHGTAISGGVTIPHAVPDGSSTVAVADFDGDGSPDIAISNASTRVISLWYVKGGAVTGGAYVSVTPALGWSVIGAADFNADGHPDLLLENATTHTAAIWYMNNGTLLKQAIISRSLTDGWDLIGSGDFNGDGSQDLLLYNAAAHRIGIWYLSGATVIGGGSLTSTLPANWSVVDARDIDGDGIADVLLQNTTAHTAVVWTVKGLVVTSSRPLSAGPPAGSQFVTGG